MVNLNKVASTATALIVQLGWTDLSDSGCKQIQHQFSAGTNSQAWRAEAVKEAYVKLWDAYDRFAYPNDTLLPRDQTGMNDLFGWGASIVDGLDTAIVMNLTGIVSEQLKHIATVDFTTSTQLVGAFDAIIRYVGGLLSAYDLLTSGLVSNGTYNEIHVAALLKQADVLSKKLKPTFNTPSGVPATFVNFTTNELENAIFTVNGTDHRSRVTAEAGTIMLEWHRLSDLIGDNSYRELADKAESILIHPVPPPRYPGLVGSHVDTDTGNYLSFDSGWQSGVDSFYEYLIKSHIYDPSADTATAYKDFWLTTVDSTIDHIALHPYGFDSLTFLSQLNETGDLIWQMDDYACFAGGNLILGGKYLGREDIVQLGLAVTDSCHQTFNTTTSGLNPIQFAWYNKENKCSNPSYDQDPTLRAFAKENGYFILNGIWAGFPEPVESLAYAYRVTGDGIWQDYAWEIFQTIQKDANRSKDVPFGDLEDVRKPLGGELVDYVPSYYFAETLKYLYMIFSPPDLLSFDEWVFNTEGHPLRIQKGTCATGK